jgi:hypothetical protein
MSKNNKKHLPFVSVCTPTFNRRPFIPIMLDCFRNQTYPKDRIEWIIVDDGTDNVSDLIYSAKIDQIKYFRLDKKMSLGEKRNYMHKQSKGSIIVYMDDDDYYPPERISHAVERLTGDPHALCAGSSEMYIYFKHIKQMYQCGPYNQNHATAGTFAFKSELLKQTQYENHAALAEEKAFLKDYTIPFVQLDPMKTILVFSHEHNTFDKRKLLENPHPDVFKPSTKTVDMFIQTKKEEHIKNFFMKDIDALLEKYDPGLPIMKPDVLKQMKEIDEERAKMMQQQMQNGPIMLQQPGKDPVALSSQEVIGIIDQQQRQIQEMVEHIKRLEMNKLGNPPFMQQQPPPFPTTSPFIQKSQPPFAQQQSPPFPPQNSPPFAQQQAPPFPPQNSPPFAQQQAPPFPTTLPFIQKSQESVPKPSTSSFINPSDTESAEQRILELEKTNIELNIKFSQTFNELQRLKRLSENQKILVENLQNEKAELLMNQKKQVSFFN